MLTQEQLKTNIDAMEKQGAKPDEVQGYLDSLKAPETPPTPTSQFGGGLLTGNQQSTDFGNGLLRNEQGGLTGENIGGVIRGAGQEAVSQGLRVAGMPFQGQGLAGRVLPNYSSQISDIQKGLQPTTDAEQAGHTLLNIGEFFLPGAASKGIKLGIEGAEHIPMVLKMLANTGIGAAEFGGLSALQGGTPQENTTAAALGGAGEAANLAMKTPLVQKAVDYLQKYVPARMMDTFLRLKDKDFAFGKQPDLGIVQEGITANTRGGLLVEIGSKKQEVGNLIGAVLRAPENANKVLSVESAINGPIQKAKQEAVNSGETLLYNRLQDLHNGLIREFEEQTTEAGQTIAPKGYKNLLLNPEEAQKLKIQVGNNVRWTNQLFDNEINQVRKQIYHGLDSLLDSNVPGIDKLNSRYANLLTAEKAMEKSNIVARRLSLWGLSKTILGGGTTLEEIQRKGFGIEPIITGIGVGLGLDFLKSPAVISRVANIIAKIPVQDAGFLTGVLRNIYLGTNQKQTSQ